MPDDATSDDDIAASPDDAGGAGATGSGPGPRRRTWPQRLTIGAAVVAAFGSFAAAGVLAAGQWVVSSRNLVVLDDQASTEPPTGGGDTTVIVPEQIGGNGAAPAPDEGPPPTFPAVEPEARNFLITGADGNVCLEPGSRFAGAFGDAHDGLSRSDTIMVWRVNPGTGQVAVLSFPRDLYVSIDGGSRGRINTAYRRDDPTRLRNTLLNEFGIRIDHYIQVDFCAFKRLVDAVGGVEVPFEFPARDSRTGLLVPEVGCYNFEGDHALAYVRSRRYQYEDPPGSGNWRTDGTSDLGRIARQQDFLRRTVASVLSRGAYTPSVVTALIETNREHLTVDSELTLSRMLQFAGVLQGLAPGEIASYQIEASPETIAGNSVLVPRLETENMRAILAVFRGEAQLADAPEQELEPTTTPAPRPRPGEAAPAAPDETGDETGGRGSTTERPADEAPVTGGDTGGDTDGDTTATTLPEVSADENLLGVAPPRDATCP